MKRIAYKQADEKLQRAEAAVDELRHLRHGIRLAAIDSAWRDFLIAANTIYSKLEVGAKDATSKSWFDRKKHERRTDPLLQYLHHARNADEHGIEHRITTHLGGIIAVEVWKRGQPKPPQGRLPTVKLMPVKDRGVTYSLPLEHLGKPIVTQTPLSLAELGLVYLRELVKEAGAQVRIAESQSPIRMGQ
jgi:hypothetical protein